MKGKEAQREMILERIGDHLLSVGIQGASLRPMAAAAGTSDRMLLYYFSDKDELMSSALTHVANRLLAMLESAQADPMPFPALLQHLRTLMSDQAMQPYMKLWVELVASAGRGDQAVAAISRKITNGFLDWIAAALEVENECDRKPLAALMLVAIDGMSLFDAIGCDSIPKLALEGLLQAE